MFYTVSSIFKRRNISELIQYPFKLNTLVMKAYGIRKLVQEQKCLFSVKICILPWLSGCVLLQIFYWSTFTWPSYIRHNSVFAGHEILHNSHLTSMHVMHFCRKCFYPIFTISIQSFFKIENKCWLELYHVFDRDGSPSECYQLIWEIRCSLQRIYTAPYL